MDGQEKGTKMVLLDKGETPRPGLNMKKAEAEEQVVLVNRLGRLVEHLARDLVVNQVQPSRIEVHGESSMQRTDHRKGPF